MLSSVVTSLRALHQWIMSFAFINQLMARLIFFPSIARMTLIEGPQHRWYDRVDDTTIIGALPFRSQTDKVSSFKASCEVSLFLELASFVFYYSL